jgi:hypothetical protein
MRLLEILLETPQEDKIIIQLAKIVNSSLPNTKGNKPIRVGSMQQYVDQLPVASQQIIGQRLSNVQLELHSSSDIQKYIKNAATNDAKQDFGDKVTAGYWSPAGETGEAGTESPTGKVVLNKAAIGTTQLISVLSHELRHVLDDSKSKMGAADSYRYNTPKKKEHQNSEYAYRAQPAEINARFVQAMDSLTRAIPVIYKLPPDKIKPRIKVALNQSLENNQISDLFPEKGQSRDYKQLIKRAFKFIENEMIEFEQTLSDQGRPKHATGNW